MPDTNPIWAAIRSIALQIAFALFAALAIIALLAALPDERPPADPGDAVWGIQPEAAP